MSENNELFFDWSEASGEFPPDSMLRAKHALNLTKFLIQKGQETSYVLNLNSKWGTGKSYFLRRWAKEIEKTYPTVYIDAWSSDHSSDPLLSVVSEIIKKFQELDDKSDFEAKLFKGIAKTIKASSPDILKTLLKGFFKKWTGTTDEQWSNLISNDDLADTGVKLVEEAIKAHIEATSGVKEIKNSIKVGLESVIKNGKRKYPLFIFIDELDRCRPTYAVEMLETIKHIFDMQNVVFVVATDKDQLQHSIKAIYGQGFDSRLYLDRFFSRTVTLSNPSREVFIERKIENSDTLKNYTENDENFAFLPSGSGRKYDLSKLLTGIADGFDWPLRTVNLWLDRLESAIIISTQKLDIILLSFMMALETDDTDWLKKYQNNVYIFRSSGSDGIGKINFRSFPINTRWSFSQCKKELFRSGINHTGSPMQDVHDPVISLIDFVTNCLTSIKNLNENTQQEITLAYNNILSGGELDTQTYGITPHSKPYHKVAFYIYTLFHYRNNTTLNNYIEICRHSSLMS